MSDLLTKCSVCGALLDEEDIFCANCGTEAPDRSATTQAATREATHNFRCQGCGASMSYDAKAGTLRCPFCGSERLEAQHDAQILAPSGVIPFALDRQRAIGIMREFLGRGFWRPNDLSQAAAIVTVTPVYVPYWVFRAKTHTYWTADTNRTPVGARGDWYPLTGEHRGVYDGVLVGASGALSPQETNLLCPFDLATSQKPEQVDLENVTVEQFTVMRKYARPLARTGLEQLEAQACRRNYVPGTCRNMHVNMRIDDLSSEPLLLPVFIMAYRYREKVFRFLINGQSGKATGEAPTSATKIVLAILAAGGAILLLLVLLGVLRG
jgi:DNA-directed RNA polymerase subunit RPC12/RpoP